MHYMGIKAGIFLSRPNRFVAHVLLDGAERVCHVKNTGRCKELLTPGAVVYCQYADSAGRKTAFDLIAVEKSGRLINMDSQAPNRVFAEWVKAGNFGSVREIMPEYRYGASRLDFRLDTPQGIHFVEVKGVTLEEDGVVRFPDAPTQRGIKHLHELQHAVEEGNRATIFFVVQMEGVTAFQPNDKTHPAFGDALREAAANGVHVAAYDCKTAPDILAIRRPVLVQL